MRHPLAPFDLPHSPAAKGYPLRRKVLRASYPNSARRGRARSACDISRFRQDRAGRSRFRSTRSCWGLMTRQTFKKALIIVHALVATAVAVVASFHVRLEGALLDERMQHLPLFLPLF